MIILHIHVCASIAVISCLASVSIHIISYHIDDIKKSSFNFGEWLPITRHGPDAYLSSPDAENDARPQTEISPVSALGTVTRYCRALQIHKIYPIIRRICSEPWGSQMKPLICLFVTTVFGQLCLSQYQLPDLLDITIDQIIAGFGRQTFSSVDLVSAYQIRIAQINPVLRAVIELNPDALSLARVADAQRLNGTIVKGPLHGVPILIKDNIATADAMNTTAGSFSLLGATVAKDSTMAAKLRQAGAIILGKSNLSQWANYRSSNSSNGWSARGGQCYGAYYPNQDPSGSSSGSAVATSVGLCAAALGSETDGSIVSPAQINGIVGIKPTIGLTSRTGVIPISAHQDTVGPMARTVKDAAYLLAAIVGRDHADNYTERITWTTPPDYVGACRADGLIGAKIGIPRQLFLNKTDAPVEAAFTEALKVMRHLGASVRDNITLPAFADFSSPNNTNETIVLDLDFKLNLKQYLDALTFNPFNITDLPSLVEYTKRDPREEYPSRNIARWDGALARNYTIEDARGFAAVTAGEFQGGPGGILGALDNNALDILVLPTQFSSKIAAIAGYPIITVPLGHYPITWPVTMNPRNTTVVKGPRVPFGIAFIGRRFSEEMLIKYAYAFEQATMVRRTVMPYVKPNIQLLDLVK